MRERAVVAAVRYANSSKDSMGGRETVETNSSSKQSSNGITTVTTRARIRDRAEQTRCDRLMALALAALAPPARSTMRPIQSNAMGMRPERCCGGPTIVAPARHIPVRTLHCTGYDARARPGPAGGRGRGSGLRMGGRAAGDCRWMRGLTDSQWRGLRALPIRSTPARAIKAASVASRSAY